MYVAGFANRVPLWRIRNRESLVEAARLLDLAGRLQLARHTAHDLDEGSVDDPELRALAWTLDQVLLSAAPLDDDRIRPLVAEAARECSVLLGANPGRPRLASLDNALTLAVQAVLDRVLAIAWRLEPEPTAVSLLSSKLEEITIAAERAANDFTGADLRSVTLTGIDLDGVLWSSRTRWPEQLRQDIERNSIPRGPDTFEILLGGVGADIGGPALLLT